MFSAVGPERRDASHTGTLSLDDLMVEVEEGEAVEPLICRVSEHPLERALGDRPTPEAGDHCAEREVHVVCRHRHVGREHAAESDTECLLHDDDSPGSRQCVAHGVVREWPERRDADDADTLAGSSEGIGGVFDGAEDRSECDDDRLGVFGPIGVEQAPAGAPEGSAEFVGEGGNPFKRVELAEM